MKKRRLYVLGFTLILSLVSLAVPQDKPKSSTFSAMAYLPSGAGMRMVGAGATANLKIYIKQYTSDAEAQQYAKILLGQGPDQLLDALQKADSIGKVSLQNRVGFFDLKLIRSRPIAGGRRVVGICDRPIGFLEAYYSGRSMDNQFGILIMDLKTDQKGKEKGEGQLIYAAKIKVLEGNKVEVENYGIEPVRLMGVRKF
jgi:hypothetical protein